MSLMKFSILKVAAQSGTTQFKDGYGDTKFSNRRTGWVFNTDRCSNLLGFS